MSVWYNCSGEWDPYNSVRFLIYSNLIVFTRLAFIHRNGDISLLWFKQLPQTIHDLMPTVASSYFERTKSIQNQLVYHGIKVIISSFLFRPEARIRGQQISKFLSWTWMGTWPQLSFQPNDFELIFVLLKYELVTVGIRSWMVWGSCWNHSNEMSPFRWINHGLVNLTHDLTLREVSRLLLLSPMSSFLSMLPHGCAYVSFSSQLM